MIDRREFLRRSGHATAGAAMAASLPSWASDSTGRRIGLPGVRFHIDWRRIEPERNFLDGFELVFYSRLVKRLLEQGLRPVPTLSLGALPPWLDEVGGWTDRATATRFAEYAWWVTEALGELVGDWVLFEEPSVFLRNAYPDQERYLRATHVSNLAVGRASRVIRARSEGARVGTVVRADLFEGATEGAEDAAAAERCRRFEVDWFLEPTLKDSYPAAFLEKIPYDRLGVQNEDLGHSPKPLDFVAVRVHERRLVHHDPADRAGTGLCYEVRSATRPVSAGDVEDVVARLTEDYGVPVYQEHSPTHETRGSWRQR